LTSVSFQYPHRFGIRPFMDATLTKEDAKAKSREALISYDLGERGFNGAPDIIGRYCGWRTNPLRLSGFYQRASFRRRASSIRHRVGWFGGDTLESAAHGARLPRPTCASKSGASSAAAEAEINTVSSI